MIMISNKIIKLVEKLNSVQLDIKTVKHCAEVNHRV